MGGGFLLYTTTTTALEDFSEHLHDARLDSLCVYLSRALANYCDAHTCQDDTASAHSPRDVVEGLEKALERLARGRLRRHHPIHEDRHLIEGDTDFVRHLP